VRPGVVALAAGALLLASCGGGSDRHDRPTPTATATSAPQPPVASCLGVTPETVTRVAGVPQVNARALAAPPGTRQHCGVVFFDGSGGMVVQVRAVPGSAADLRQASRQAAVSAGGARPERIRPMPGFGPGAFRSGRRVIGFHRAGNVVTVETGYGTTGRLALDPRALEAIARTAANGS
jgi:hypothetical protein